jgi:hypothetical protein
VPLEIEHCKTADIAKRVNMYSEFTEKVDDRWCTRRQRKPENKGSKNDRKELSGVNYNFHGK